jgi:hypothetical protein
VPAELLPDSRLLPNVPDEPEMAKLLKAMLLFDSRTDELLCTSTLLWLIVELSTAICAPESPSMPVPVPLVAT